MIGFFGKSDQTVSQVFGVGEMDTNFLDFLTPEDLAQVQKAIGGMKKAVDDYEFNLSVLRSFTLAMQNRILSMGSAAPMRWAQIHHLEKKDGPDANRI